MTMNISCQSLLACKVSFEKSADSLMGTPLSVTNNFSLAAFYTFSLDLLFDDAQMIVLQLSTFPKRWYFGWEELWAQPRIGLTWQEVAGLFFFGCSRGNRL